MPSAKRRSPTTTTRVGRPSRRFTATPAKATVAPAEISTEASGVQSRAMTTKSEIARTGSATE